MGCRETELGKMAISEESPAGAYPRDGARYMAAQTEIDKLISIHAGTPIDWTKVAEDCVGVLRDEGKDLNAAV